mgnify:FL=1|jgi:hypothetical protein
MLEQIFTNEMTYWLLGTALVFTYVGRWMAYKEHLMDIVESTIDRLVEDGYIKTKGEGEKLELLKHWEK